MYICIYIYGMWVIRCENFASASKNNQNFASASKKCLTFCEKYGILLVKLALCLLSNPNQEHQMGQNRSADSTGKWNKLLNSKPSYPLKSGGAANGVGRLEKK